MALIEFQNNTSPYLNAENLNNNFQECFNIVESGSNQNGNYIKFSDGTLICYNRQQFNAINCSFGWGSLYTSNSDPRSFNDFPVAFISPPTVSLKIENSSTDGWIFSRQSQGGATTTNVGGWQICRATTSSSMNVEVSYLAIGKWK